MEHSIRPYIHNENPKYTTLFTEIHKLPLVELNKIIADIENVFNGKYKVSSFCGDVVSTVEFDKDISRIEYYSETIGEEPTIDIYNMLKAYRDKLVEYQKTKSQD